MMEWEITRNKSLLDKFKSLYFGKTIGFIGTDNVGKSTLLKYMITQTVDSNISSTENIYLHKGLIIRIKDQNSSDKVIRIKIANDVGGQRFYHESREKAFKQSDYIIYTVRSDIFLDKNLDIEISHDHAKKDERIYTLDAVKKDFALFQKWKKKHPLFIVVGNYFGNFSNFADCDFKKKYNNIPIFEKNRQKSGVPDFLNQNYKIKYSRKLKESLSKVVGESNELLKKARFSVGSIVTEKLARQLVLDILSNFT